MGLGAGLKGAGLKGAGLWLLTSSGGGVTSSKRGPAHAVTSLEGGVNGVVHSADATVTWGEGHSADVIGGGVTSSEGGGTTSLRGCDVIGALRVTSSSPAIGRGVLWQ